MLQTVEQTIALAVAFLGLNPLLPLDINWLPAAATAAPNGAVTVNFQKGNERAEISETDDGTIISRFVEGTVARPTDYEGNGYGTELVVKRIKETAGAETTIETQRFLIAFPNIIGDEPKQIPKDATVDSAVLTLTLASITGPENLQINAYRMLERWEENESGFLRAPSWKQYQRSTNQGENLWANEGADVPKSADTAPVAERITMPRAAGAKLSLDVREAVKSWMNGNANNGLMIKLSDEAIGSALRIATFYSSDSPITELRPKLEITYTPKAPPATPEPPPCPTLSAPFCPYGFVTGLTANYDAEGRCVTGYNFECKEAVPTSAPVSVPETLPPSPPKTGPVPEKQNAQSRPTPAAPAPQTEEPAMLPQKETVEPETQSSVRKIFSVIQKNILETWEKIIRLFR